MTNRNTTTRFRFWLWLLCFVGLIVPRRLRADWRQEWEAELRYREALLAEWDKLDGKNKLVLLWHSAGAFVDALWLQPKRWEDEMMQDLRFGVRMLVKYPGFTVVAVLTLVLGIGANTALFSVIDAVLLRPLPFTAPAQLVEIGNAGYLFDFETAAVAPMKAAKEDVAAFAEVATGELGRVNLNTGNEADRLNVMCASATLFPLLGRQPMLGRVFAGEEQQVGRARVAVLSYRLWQTHFGADAAALKRRVQLSGIDFVIIGVMPREFEFYVGQERADLYVPLLRDDKLLSTPGWGTTVARLKPDITLQQARAGMEGVFQRAVQQRPDLRQHRDTQLVKITPLREAWAGKMREPLLILLGAVGCVLLIACANAANLLLARAATRQKEIAIRTALGATRLRLLRQCLTESTMLALLGGALGFGFAAWGVKAIVAVSPIYTPMLETVTMDRRVLGFTLIVSLLVGVLFGLAPAWQFSRLHWQQHLKEGGQRGTGSFSPRLRNALLVAEIALALVLLINAGVLVKSFLRLLDVPLGFDPHNVLTLELSPAANKYPERVQRADFYQQVIARVRVVPGVEAVGTINHLPLVGGDFIVPVHFSESTLTQQHKLTFSYRLASADYFRAMRIPLLAGRYFTEADHAQAPRVCVLEQTLAERLKQDVFPNESLIGKHLVMLEKESYEVVGIVADIRHQGLDARIYPGFYLPMSQRAPQYAALAIRSTMNPALLTAAISQAITEVDKDHPIYKVKTMEQHVMDSISQRRFAMLMFSLFSSLSLLLAAVGIYGVMSFVVTQRTHEIGVRLALGAQTNDVLRLIVTQGMKLILPGVVCGLAASFALKRMIAPLLYNVNASDPSILLFTPCLLAAIALLACYLPALRAARVDPLVALRHE